MGRRHPSHPPPHLEKLNISQQTKENRIPCSQGKPPDFFKGLYHKPMQNSCTSLKPGDVFNKPVQSQVTISPRKYSFYQKD